MKVWTQFLVFRMTHAVFVQQQFSDVTFTRVADQRLNEVTFATHYTKSWSRCLNLCLDDIRCHSVNFHQETRVCKFKQVEAATEDELDTEVGWQHFCEIHHSSAIREWKPKRMSSLFTAFTEFFRCGRLSRRSLLERRNVFECSRQFFVRLRSTLHRNNM